MSPFCFSEFLVFILLVMIDVYKGFFISVSMKQAIASIRFEDKIARSSHCVILHSLYPVIKSSYNRNFRQITLFTERKTTPVCFYSISTFKHCSIMCYFARFNALLIKLCIIASELDL